MKIILGSDHAGITFKKSVIDFLLSRDYEIEDMGAHLAEISVDYPDFIHPVARKIDKAEAHLGIIFCGSGNGAAMTANKYPNVRAALIWDKEQARLAKAHNNANIISIPARFVKQENLLEIIEVFLATSFEKGRHQKRIEKIKRKEE